MFAGTNGTAFVTNSLAILQRSIRSAWSTGRLRALSSVSKNVDDLIDDSSFKHKHKKLKDTEIT